MMTDDAQPFAEWIGRTEAVEDFIAAAPAQAAAATLDDAESGFAEGSALPPLWHWFYFLPKAPASRIGPDGHPRRGGFLPPIPLPRRMFAGARLSFLEPLVIGRQASREGVIRAVSQKTGRSGTLAFVTVGYTIRQNGRKCVEEEQDIVYREPGALVPAPQPAPLPPLPDGAVSRMIEPDPVLLFRFSALTFNAHRIHYDRPYATGVEGYPGLVVHGPLTAVLLMELVRRNIGRPVRAFSFRGQAPLFDLAPFRISGVTGGDTVELEALGPDGKPATSAIAELS
jgi:3-methylfumaryl-CoA hydratase